MASDVSTFTQQMEAAAQLQQQKRAAALAAAEAVNASRVAPRSAEDYAPKEEGAGASFRALKHKARLAKQAITGAPDIAEKAKEELKNWAIDALLPSWGIIRWFRAGANGEALSASRIIRLIVLLFRKTLSIFIVLGALGLLALIVSFYTDPWKLLSAIVSMGWGAIKILYDLLSKSGVSDITP